MLNYHRAVSSRPEFARPPFSPVSPIAHIIFRNAIQWRKIALLQVSCGLQPFYCREGTAPVLSTSPLILKVS
jgi:hypothetical protein